MDKCGSYVCAPLVDLREEDWGMKDRSMCRETVWDKEQTGKDERHVEDRKVVVDRWSRGRIRRKWEQVRNRGQDSRHNQHLVSGLAQQAVHEHWRAGEIVGAPRTSFIHAEPAETRHLTSPISFQKLNMLISVSHHQPLQLNLLTGRLIHRSSLEPTYTILH